MFGSNQSKNDEKVQNKDYEKNPDLKVTSDSLVLVFFV